MAINNVPWASGDQVTLSKQTDQVDDMVNSVDNIHSQYDHEINVSSGMIARSHDGSEIDFSFFIVQMFRHILVGAGTKYTVYLSAKGSGGVADFAMFGSNSSGDAFTESTASTFVITRAQMTGTHKLFARTITVESATNQFGYGVEQFTITKASGIYACGYGVREGDITTGDFFSGAFQVTRKQF